jgi:hypothetical protein
MDITQCKEKKKRMRKNEQSPRDLWENIKNINISMRILEGKETELGAEKIFEEITAKQFPNLTKDMNLHV